MTESPRSEKYCLTRYSTPVPELDDHRDQMDPMDPLNLIENSPDLPSGVQNTADRHPSMEPHQRQDLLGVSAAFREADTHQWDFEQAIVDDDQVGLDPIAARRFSTEPTESLRPGRRFSRNQQDIRTLSRGSSVSARSPSPPNSVEAFADPRRRERANTLESQVAPDVEAILHRTVSGGTQARRPTFSNASAIRPQPGDIPLEPTDDDLPYDQPGAIPIIDYEELEEFVALNSKSKPAAAKRKHSLSSQSKKPRVFYDLRPGASPRNVTRIQDFSSPECPLVDFFDPSADNLEKTKGHILNEKELVETLQNENEPTRFGFFSSESQSTVHAAELGDLVLPGDTFRDLFQLGPEGGVWWLDVVNPTEAEVGALSRAFSIHPLTTEDIVMQEAREKVELFKQYYFVCFRTFYQLDKTSDQFLEPVNFYMVVFRDGVITFSFTETPHAANVRKRIGKLREYVSLSSDWICYAMM